MLNSGWCGHAAVVRDGQIRLASANVFDWLPIAGRGPGLPCAAWPGRLFTNAAFAVRIGAVETTLRMVRR